MKHLYILVAGTFMVWLVLFAMFSGQGIVTSKIGIDSKTISLDLRDLARNKEEKQLISDVFPGHPLKTIRPKRKVILLYIDGFRESFIDGDFVNYVGDYHSYRMNIFKDLIEADPSLLQLST